MPPPGPAPARSQRLLLPLCVLLIAAARLCWLDVDPPASMPDPTSMDEGLWADSARGIVWFEQGYFADDLGNAYLIAPLYTWLLAAIYWLLGVGLWQTRLLAALASIATAALAGDLVRRRLGGGAGALVALLLGACPLLDQHGRFALLESTQAFWLLLSFALLFPRAPATWKAVLAGAAMGAAVLIKPNSVQFGVLPFAAAFVLGWWRDARAGRPDHRRRLHTALAVTAGGAAVIAALGLPVWLSHWEAFVATVAHESGEANWRLSDHVLRQGLLLGREAEPGRHQLWALLRHAPLCTIGVWLLLVRRATGRARPAMPGERELWCWLATALLVAETSYDHVARREVLFVAPMAIFAVQCWRHRSQAAAPDLPPWPRYLQWLLLCAPPVLLIKPWLANAMAPHLPDLAPDLPGAQGYLAGWLALTLLPALPAIAVALRVPAAGLLGAASRAGPWLLPALLAYECTQLGALPPHETTIRDAQRQVAELLADRGVTPDDVVLGENAALLCQTIRVRTVRRVVAGQAYSSPRPNPDVAERLRPRFLVDYTDPALRRFADLLGPDFRSIGRVGYLREPSGQLRFDLELWERR